MKPFHTIAIPSKDILEGKLTMDIFAANLWEVYHNRGPEEYKDSDLFFKKTYLTKGLSNLFNVVEKRIKGKGGDSVIQLQTPFGGGKTHSLIALYHKSKEWKVKNFIFVGDEASPKDNILWEEMEKQLTGSIKELKGNIVPSGEKIRKVLEKSPCILMLDELIEYLIPARGIKIEGTTFDTQILSFIKRLADVVSSLDKVILIVTSPSRTQYSEENHLLLSLLSERLGRVKKSLTPVEDDEITSIIRKRLFSKINEEEAKGIVSEVSDYFKKESILPQGTEYTEYRDKFLLSYPFLPDVVECFYHKWGSFPEFQRTRGVLKILSTIIYDLRNENINYISLADCKLSNQDLRRELMEYIGSEFDSVIAADIADKNSGSKQVDKSLGESYKGLQIGTRSANTLFLYSFSGGQEKGASINEIKRNSSIVGIPSSVVAEAVEQLKEKLFFIQQQAGKIYFTNKPNLNRILLSKIENVGDKDIELLERERLVASTKETKLKTYVWPTQSNDIPDDSELKLIILKEKNKEIMKSILENKGNSPRVFRNTIFFLLPTDSKKYELYQSIKRKIAFGKISEDGSIILTDEQKKGVKNSLAREEENVQYKVRDTYRLLQVPDKNKFDELDLGIHTEGCKTNLSEEVFNKLKTEGIVIQRMAPLVLKEKYLKNKKSVSTKQILENSIKTLGENRILNKLVLEECIRDGVKQGVFGLGELSDSKIIPIYWKKDPTISFLDNEIIIEEEICVKELIKKEIPEEEKKEEPKEEEVEITETKKGLIEKLELPYIKVPKGKVSQLLGLMNFIQSKFDSLKVKIEADEGKLTKEDYEKVKESLKQMGVNLD